MLDESALGALTEIGTTRIGDFNASSKLGMWEMKLFNTYRESEIVWS
jgi:hypothetical protein